MAKNEVSSEGGGVHIYTAFASGNSGDPKCIGTVVPSAGAGHYTNLTGTLLTTVAAGSATIDTSEQIFRHAVHGLNATGNSAVVIGDAVYYHLAAPNIAGVYLNKNSTTGTLFGFALQPVASGGTGTIEVRQKG